MKKKITTWQKAATIKNHPEFHSTPLEIRKILLALPEFSQTARIGWYFGKSDYFIMDGSPSMMEPTHWMPLPELPKQ